MLKYKFKKILQLIVETTIIIFSLAIVLYFSINFLNLIQKKLSNSEKKVSFNLIESIGISIFYILPITLLCVIIFLIFKRHLKGVSYRNLLGIIISAIVIFMLYLSTWGLDFSNTIFATQFIISSGSGYFVAKSVFRFLEIE